MGNQYEVNPNSIKTAGGRIYTSAQQLKADWEAFQAELAAFGEPWGTDEIGSLIGGCYQAIYELAAECYADNIAALEEQADKVKIMAANHFAAEDASVIEVNRVRDILG
ncbi:hypothetical protein [Thermomonospora curvata]|uniref:PE domain-containing protein n=1 Tax=Thermomonospora curvata (strain ATCC 19995 / DSM 43183 / JCM 3096 / KCTC 9072 / NBRC 15933 / NCIMB 10081 / Henssen B9) TaxID=471852 RepID=D1A3F4_THECD|nr:hypothetical protein [Thermomonospora curvata]ACY96079.1 hypothetical protein Tcur_0482 [Thermomonospora curvata DSM 43183]